MFKILFWLGLIGGGVFIGGQVIPVYYNNLKIQNVFEGTTENFKDKSESRIKTRVRQLLGIQSIDLEALPKDFSNDIIVTKENGKVTISSEYHITLWLLGEPQSVNYKEEYKETDVKPMDKLRLKARMDFDFAPYAESQ